MDECVSTAGAGLHRSQGLGSGVMEGLSRDVMSPHKGPPALLPAGTRQQAAVNGPRHLSVTNNMTYLGRWGSFPDSSVGKESACNAGDMGSIPGLGRYPGEGKGYPLQDSCLENPIQSMGSQRVGHD